MSYPHQDRSLYLTAKSAAREYDWPTGEACLKWCKRNGVPVSYMGRKARILRASLEEAIKRGRRRKLAPAQPIGRTKERAS